MNIPSPISHLTQGQDGIFGVANINPEQSVELSFREKVASESHSNYLDIIAQNHSVNVMDQEVSRFIAKIPQNGIICDIGGCWGWHWRNLHLIRPDLTVLIVDFCRSNLIHAQNLLNDRIGQNIFLVHDDATALSFPNESIDGYWTVQTLQHIPNYEKAVKEAYRILKVNGIFANYALNRATAVELLYKVMGRQYLTNGTASNSFFLRRMDDEQRKYIAQIFSKKVVSRYSEVLFNPEIKLAFSGKPKSWIGTIDAKLSGSIPLFSPFARQQSIHTVK